MRLQLHRGAANARKLYRDQVAFVRMKNANPGARGDDRAGRHAAAIPGCVAKPGRQHENRITQGMGALVLNRRLRADLDPAHLRLPVLWRKWMPGAKHECAVRLEVGELGQSRQPRCVNPASVDGVAARAAACARSSEARWGTTMWK